MATRVTTACPEAGKYMCEKENEGCILLCSDAPTARVSYSATPLGDIRVFRAVATKFCARKLYSSPGRKMKSRAITKKGRLTFITGT